MEKEQTKNQQENQKKSQKLQWHPAFCSALRLELLEDAENLEFTDEFQLTEKPLQIDCTVVKVKKDCKIKNEIGKIFRKHNIFEYKSPMDELNIDTFYKAVAYACLYKVLPNHVNEIPAEEITITLIRDRKPVKLMQELEKRYEGKLRIQTVVSRETAAGSLTGRIPALIERGERESTIGLPMNKETSHVMLCGNPQMVRDTQQLLKETRQMTKHLRRRPGHMTAEHYW